MEGGSDLRAVGTPHFEDPATRALSNTVSLAQLC